MNRNMKVLFAHLNSLGRDEMVRNDLPYDWTITEATTLEEYTRGLGQNPDLVVFQSNPNMGGHHDAVLINMARREPGFHTVIILSDALEHIAPEVNESEVIFTFNRAQWTNENGRLKWMEMVEACRRAAAGVGCA